MTTDLSSDAALLADAERELSELRDDQRQLDALREKYAAELSGAEQAWKAKRDPAKLDAMQRAKSLLETVTASLRDQAHEVAKAEALVAHHRERVRRREVLSALAEDAQALSHLQSAHSEGVLALQATVWAEALRLLGVRDDWRQRHDEAWAKVRSLSPDVSVGLSAVEEAGIDLAALRMAAPAVGTLAPHQQSYRFPEHADPDVRKAAEPLMHVLMRPELARHQARAEAQAAQARRHRAYFPYGGDLDAPDLAPARAALPDLAVDADDEEGRPFVQAGQTVTREPLGGES